MRQLQISEKITDRDTPSVEKYLRDISKYDLITAEREAELARRIRAGDKDAEQELVRANLRFVVSVAKQYQNQGLNLSDLINEGNIGLVKAAGKFDETRGFKFISYAVWWIRQSIISAIAESSRMIRLPLNKVSDVRKVKRTMVEFEQKYEREPTNDELAQLLNINKQKIEDTLGISFKHMSLDTPYITGEEVTLLDKVENPNAEETDHEMAVNESLKLDIEEALSTLSEQQREVVRLSFGLGGNEPVGLPEIAHKLNVSGERIRQIRAKALTQLKRSSKMLKVHI